METRVRLICRSYRIQKKKGGANPPSWFSEIQDKSTYLYFVLNLLYPQVTFNRRDPSIIKQKSFGHHK
jgi:hypothetical protein